MLLIVMLIAVAAILSALVVADRGFLDMYRLHREDAAGVREIEAARREIDSLKREIELLKTDTAFIERVARERLGMAQKGERIFKFIEGDE